MELVAFGAQDMYLVSRPTVSFFKAVYRRHTNFACENILQTFNGTVDFGNNLRCTIARSGDLIKGGYFRVKLPSLTTGGTQQARWIDAVGHFLIKHVDISIGGQVIDKHYADWLEIWAQLSVSASKSSAYYTAIGSDVRGGASIGLQTTTADAATTVNVGPNLDVNGRRTLYVPLQFWFCRNIGLSLPLIALQYHEVVISVQLEQLSKLHLVDDTDGVTAGTGTSKFEFELWMEYVFLDVQERRRFAQVSHEYLIEELQFTGNESFTNAGNQTINLNLNHPVKALYWVSKRDDAYGPNYTTRATAYGADDMIPNDTNDDNGLLGRSKRALNPTQSAKLQLNGQDRFAEQEGSYFNTYVPLKCHTCAPDSPGINVYSFALRPEEYQPTASCNFSRIDTARLLITFDVAMKTNTTGNTKVFAVNWNVLRIMGGMAGKAYSN
jgi:hypothetical protein